MATGIVGHVIGGTAQIVGGVVGGSARIVGGSVGTVVGGVLGGGSRARQPPPQPLGQGQQGQMQGQYGAGYAPTHRDARDAMRWQKRQHRAQRRELRAQHRYEREWRRM